MQPDWIGRAYGLHEDWLPLGEGHIHQTFRSADERYILQKINTYVFRDPDGMMENILRFTEHLKRKLREAGQDPKRGTLSIVQTKDGGLLTKAPDGSVYRIYECITDTYSVEYGSQTAASMRECGRIFADFHCMSADYPIDRLMETIPRFHDTKKRVEDLYQAVNEDRFGRAAGCKKEIADALRKADAVLKSVPEAIEKGEVPVTAAHNDAKQNNVLFDRHTHRAVAVIDLDTVMPGSRLHDVGEMLRMGAGTVNEDSSDQEGMRLDLSAAEAFASGYLPVMKDRLNAREKELLTDGCVTMCYENGIRFLTDHLNGDVYYGAAREGQNLDRARTQLKMADLFEENREALDGIFRRYL